MNTLMKRISSGLLALMIVVSLLCLPASAAPAGNAIVTTPSGYTSASDVKYVKDGNYIANWGARSEICTFLSTYAQNYYTGDNAFDELSDVTGGTGMGNAPSSQLYMELKELMESNHKFYTYYDGNQNVRQFYKYTDCLLSDTSKVSILYRGETVTSAWNSGKIWNQEHVWPQSKLSNKQQVGDIMHLRPANPSENSGRGNKAYGVSTGKDYYDPGVSVRGDCARTVLYMYVRWGTTNTMWGGGGVIESLDILLEWMAKDPVDTWEMGRNDAVQSITGVRNVFVDYPEYAWLLFGQDVPVNLTSPSNGNHGGTTPTPPTTTPATTPSTTPSTTPPTTQPVTPTTGYNKVSTLNDGDRIVIINPASNKALSTVKTGYYNMGIDVSGGFGSITEAEIFTVKKNSDGSWSFISGDGKKLALSDEYGSLNETGANDRWELTSAGTDQFYLKNTGRNMYLEWYASKDNWSTYNTNSLNQDYVLAFYKKAGSSTTTPGTSTPGTSTPGTTTPDSTPATQPGESVPETSAPTTQPEQTDPDATPGTTPSGNPNSPAPLETKPLNPDDFVRKDEGPAPGVIVAIVLATMLVMGGCAYAVIYFFVIKPKKSNTPFAQAEMAKEEKDRTEE